MTPLRTCDRTSSRQHSYNTEQLTLTKTASISFSLKFLTRGFHIRDGACQNSSKAPVSAFALLELELELGPGCERLGTEDDDAGEDEDSNFLRKSAKCFLYSGGAAGWAWGASGSD